MEDKSIKLELSRVFDAPRELVFKAWTDEDQFKQWFGAAACGGGRLQSVKVDARVGGKYRIQVRHADGEFYTTVGTYRAVEPPERLVFTWAFEKDGSGEEFGEVEPCEMLVTLEFRARGKQTELILTHENFASVESRDRHEQGWTRCLNELGKVVGQDGPLVVERTFEAPVAVVWEAITTKAGMERWFFELTEFKPQAGFEFQFAVEYEGHRYDHRCRVTEVIRQQRISFTWRYAGHAGDSLVTFELFAEGGDQTRLKLTHTGLETFPKTPAFARRNFMQGWTHFIGSSLKDYVEQADREIFVTRDFAAPQELVWEALTNPRHVVNWWGPRGFTTTIETMDVRPGGVWEHTMHGPDGVKYPNYSVFQEVVKPERLVYAHEGRRENGPGVNFVATWTFESFTAEKTRVTLRMVFASAGERDFVAKEFGAVEGAQQTFERLGEHLANAPAQNAARPNSQQSQVALSAGR
jgi:uncharacterized protein YndB with AHSA1/START domain